jgi:hypothetical protein
MEPKPGTLDYEVMQEARLRDAITKAKAAGKFAAAARAKNELDRYRWKLRNRGWKSQFNQPDNQA